MQNDFFHAVKHISSLPPNLPVLSRDFYAFHCSWVRKNNLLLFAWKVEKPLQANLKSLLDPKKGFWPRQTFPGVILRDKKELSSFLFLFTDTWWCPLLLQSSPGHPRRCPGSDFFPKNLPYHSWRGAEVTQMSKGDPTVSDGWGNSTYPIF